MFSFYIFHIVIYHFDLCKPKKFAEFFYLNLVGILFLFLGEPVECGQLVEFDRL